MAASVDAKLLDRSLAELRESGTKPVLMAGPPVQSAKPAVAAAAPVLRPAAAAAVAPVRVSLAAAPKRVIRIIGAEGGDREIPYEVSGRAQ
jgi:hypothetical protein